MVSAQRGDRAWFKVEIGFGVTRDGIHTDPGADFGFDLYPKYCDLNA